MAETKQEESKKPLKLSRPGRLELKKTVETGTVKQSFSHGRSKAVTVEVKRKRTFKRGEGDSMSEVKEAEDLGAFGPGQDGRLDGPLLSEAERQARRRALDAAQQADGGDVEAAPEVSAASKAREDAEAMFSAGAEAVDETPDEAAVEAEEPAEAEQAAEPEHSEAEPAETAPAEEAPPPPVADAPRSARELEADEARAEADRLARELAGKELGQLKFKPSSKVPPKPTATTPQPATTPVADSDPSERTDAKPKKRGDAKRPATPSRRGEPRRREGRLTITQALEIGDAGMERKRSEAATRRRRERERQRQRELESQGEYKKMSREVVVPESITVQELANRMAEKGADLVKALMKMDVMATINQPLDADTAELLVEEFGHRIKRVSESDVEIGLGGDEDRPEDMKSRAPVVTVMGHVDHGKTSLLDALRETDVVAREAGGITQHIGAYQVVLSAGQRITFLDTPGHAAFTQMRARGANVTDLVILVVAADDGVQPQTMEAIAHAKAAGVPIIVAINKIDTKGADADRVRTELLQHDIQVEEMGGDVLSVEVSAKEKTNLDKLEEAILLQAELLELKANPDRSAQGIVVEAKLERGRGPVATVLIQRGTLKVGDVFIAGGEWGRVRALVNDRGESTDTAGPSNPVEVLGLQGAPSAGDEFSVVENEGRAREISEYRQRTAKKESVAVRGSIEQMFSAIKAGQTQELPVLIKADVQGSAEAITSMLEGLSTDEVGVQVLHSGVGAISESDITLAKASGGLIIAFNVRANAQARTLAERDGVDIRYYSVIYDINDDIKGMLSGMLAPERRETFLGYAEILEVFKVSKVGNVAGCRVTEGLVKRGAGVRLLRDNVVVHEGSLATLKRFKDEVKEVRGGMECGMSFENYQDIRVGDQIECYEVEEVAREL